MRFQLKMLSPGAVPAALEKARLYRLLNEPGEAESICRDALEVDRDNQDVLVMLLLSLTDQFDSPAATTAIADAREVLERLKEEYTRAYYSGIVFERRAKAQLHHNIPGYGPRVYAWLREAMDSYEKAESIRPSGNDDALLRWNACARLLNRDHHLAPAVEERGEPLLLE
jgi:tetratricopeptide (TPR) repeat protein